MHSIVDPYAELALEGEDPNDRPLQLCIDTSEETFHQNCKVAKTLRASTNCALTYLVLVI